MIQKCSSGRQIQNFQTFYSAVRQKAMLLALLAIFHPAVANGGDYRVGVFYFPGWKIGQLGNARDYPWEPIKNYPEREPLLGWYEEDGPGVMSTQLKWMRDYGVDYVVFDWFWGSTGRPHLSHGVNAYLTAEDRHGVDFAILWANHTKYAFSVSQFDELFRFWVQRYFFRSDYLRVFGKPVVFLFSADTFNKNAVQIGLNSAALIARAESIAREFGLPGVAFIGGVSANGRGFDYSAASGYAGFSAYNFHGMATRSYAPGRSMSHSYAELDLGYQDHWQWMAENASGLYIVPMTSGWDKRAWGGSKDPMHDNSVSTQIEFGRHLQSAREFMNRNPERTQSMGVICCWNEFGEGSYIEPTKMHGFRYLEEVKRVFGAPQE